MSSTETPSMLSICKTLGLKFVPTSSITEWHHILMANRVFIDPSNFDTSGYSSVHDKAYIHDSLTFIAWKKYMGFVLSALQEKNELVLGDRNHSHNREVFEHIFKKKLEEQ
jgi:hypothetical protein